MYHIHHDNQAYGPYTLDELNQYLAQGYFNAQTLAFDPSANAWVEVWTIFGVVVPGPSPKHGDSSSDEKVDLDQLYDVSNTDLNYCEPIEGGSRVYENLEELVNDVTYGKQIEVALFQSSWSGFFKILMEEFGGKQEWGGSVFTVVQ